MTINKGSKPIICGAIQLSKVNKKSSITTVDPLVNFKYLFTVYSEVFHLMSNLLIVGRILPISAYSTYKTTFRLRKYLNGERDQYIHALLSCRAKPNYISKILATNLSN